MPYDSNSQLPEAVQNSLSESDQTKWRKVFNSALSDTCDNDDTCAAKVAWSQMKKNARHFAGWATAEIVDKQGDKIEIGAFKSTMQKFMKLGATIIDKHSNRKVGSYIDYEFRNKDSNAALWMEGVIYKGHRIHDETWDKIKSGEYPALSIGADPLESKKECDAKTCWNAIKAIDLFEISVVDAPANPEATIEEVNTVAKSDITLITKGDSMTEPETKEKEDVDGGEPVAESTDKSEFDAEAMCKALAEQMTSMKAQFDKAFPPEEEEEEEEEPEEDEDKEKSTEVAAEPSATLTIKEIKKAVKEGVQAELKKLTANKEADTPRPDLKKHEMSAPFQKALENPDELAKMSIKEIDAMMGEPKVGEKPW